MRLNEQQSKRLIEKLQTLPRERIKEVEDFIDFLVQRQEQGLTDTAMRLSEPSFEEIWDNPEDDIYDKL